MIRPHVAMQIKAALEAEGKEVPQHVLAALEPVVKIPKKRLVAAMYLLGASLTQLGRLAGMQRSTAYHYVRDELRGVVPKRVGMGVKGKKNESAISNEHAEIYWAWLQVNQQLGFSAEQLAALASKNAMSGGMDDAE